MPSLVFTATSPSDTAVSRILYPERVYISQKMNEPGSLIAIFDSDCDDLWDETSATNPLQLNSYITVERNGYYIFPVLQYFDGEGKVVYPP